MTSSMSTLACAREDGEVAVLRARLGIFLTLVVGVWDELKRAEAMGRFYCGTDVPHLEILEEFVGDDHDVRAPGLVEDLIVGLSGDPAREREPPSVDIRPLHRLVYQIAREGCARS
eukprot:CAMPEP_0118888646 /NCGR_PEP_ID=MMETSP1163-20130328/25827_1 /TAXON_ID=124430 /ORGANISM="Phaeomonas parva, Strain CCMP2877" /LENGTH=115 /DNA_ID=CAMNT_0006827217 /DNA_START=994 /DNA_END=1337 /DNA_ORIENTATION=-